MESRKELKDVGAGDKVWVGDKRDQRRSLRMVEKVTPKQIVLTLDRDRYRRDTFRNVDKYSNRCLTDVATPEECEAWAAEVEERKRRDAERGIEEGRRAALRLELTGLLGPVGYVGDSDEPERGEFKVRLYLSEEGVRRLAEYLSAAPPPAS